MDGIINIKKEKGYTSHDVVAKLRGILHQRKIGHTGTLDPDATGVLPVCIGKATKVSELLMEHDKTYRAVCQLGVATDTQDVTGQVLHRGSWEHLDEQALRQCLESFVGPQEQIPPMYSALKVNGRKLYELAREGVQVERKPRTICINSLKLEDVDWEHGRFAMEVDCSRGTYIRTLCHDIGERLGCPAAMYSLVRTRVAVFYLEDAVTLDALEQQIVEVRARRGEALPVEEAIADKLITVDSLFPEYERYRIDFAYSPKLANGNILLPQYLRSLSDKTPEQIKQGEHILVHDENGRFKAVYIRTGKNLHVVKIF